MEIDHQGKSLLRNESLKRNEDLNKNGGLYRVFCGGTPETQTPLSPNRTKFTISVCELECIFRKRDSDLIFLAALKHDPCKPEELAKGANAFSLFWRCAKHEDR